MNFITNHQSRITTTIMYHPPTMTDASLYPSSYCLTNNLPTKASLSSFVLSSLLLTLREHYGWVDPLEGILSQAVEAVPHGQRSAHAAVDLFLHGSNRKWGSGDRSGGKQRRHFLLRTLQTNYDRLKISRAYFSQVHQVWERGRMRLVCLFQPSQ